MTHALPYDAVLFDLDGTLTASEPGIVNSVQYALRQLGVTRYRNEELSFFVGPPLMCSFCEDVGLTQAQALRAIELYRERYAVTGLYENAVYTGIPALLRSLKAHGVHVGIATSKPEFFARRVLDHFGLSKYVDTLAGPGGEGEDKSKARLARRALPERYARACMVGDRHMDVEAAQAVGIDGIAALYGYGTPEEFHGATYMAETVEDLTRYLLGGANVEPGPFVTLEGVDGCGKTTQKNLVANWMRDCGHKVVETREPGGCPISERIRAIVLDKDEMGMTDPCEALLFAASRAQHVHEVIVPALARGDAVLCDRFVDSSVAYQGAGRALGMDFVRAINAPGVNGCMPKLTILYDVDVETGLARRCAADTPDRIEKADIAVLRRIREAYIDMARVEPERIFVADAAQSPEAVFEATRRILAEAL